jgi:hypothetical protein
MERSKKANGMLKYRFYKLGLVGNRIRDTHSFVIFFYFGCVINFHVHLLQFQM